MQTANPHKALELLLSICRDAVLVARDGLTPMGLTASDHALIEQAGRVIKDALDYVRQPSDVEQEIGR